MQVARYYCRKGQTTISLLPDCLASHLSSSLAEVEQVVETVDAAASLWKAAEKLRPDITLLSAARWVRSRLRGVRAAMLSLIGLFPDLFVRAEPTIASFRRALDVTDVLVAMRETGAAHLKALPPPVGFGPRQKVMPPTRHQRQHDMGPDPPKKTG